ncbi:uncharacterized protein [Pocillopora verrucosa]|uniref:uncharacterized protein n=1 Tax=Pocillopora verrucosa TaxID=203993 RepID=UPI003342BEB5
MVVQGFFHLPVVLSLLVLFHSVFTQYHRDTREDSIFGMMLQNHIFKTITRAAFGDECLRECYHDIRCQSFNYVFTQDKCELSNRTKEARPEDFVPNSERYYFRRDMNRVILGAIPELPAGSCKEIKASEGGQAVSGYYWVNLIKRAVLLHCDMKIEDADECNASIPVCDANADCKNTLGSYSCSCKAGFLGDGKTCRDIDECSASIRVCNINADCHNTLGSYSCSCKPGFTGNGMTCAKRDAKNCADKYNSGERSSGVYSINPDGSGAFNVFCDQTTAGGGWTVFQKRLDGSVDFYLNWTNYKTGFGSLNGEFWLGLDRIHRLTNSSNNKLRVDLEDMSGNTAYAEYSVFTVGNDATKYQLNVNNYSGNASDSLAYHNGYPFMTKDVSSSNCAVTFKGAWWYRGCYESSLNGVYHHGKYTGVDSIRWHGFLHHSAKRAEMKMRPINL